MVPVFGAHEAEADSMTALSPVWISMFLQDLNHLKTLMVVVLVMSARYRVVPHGLCHRNARCLTAGMGKTQVVAPSRLSLVMLMIAAVVTAGVVTNLVT